MSVGLQKRIIRTTGVSLTTMLFLTLAQALLQITRFFDLNQILMLLIIVFPIFALLSGAASHLLAGSPWCAILSSAVAFSLVLFILFTTSSVIYVPLYVVISLLGYFISQWVVQRRKAH